MKIEDFKTKKAMKEFVGEFMHMKLEKNEVLTDECIEYNFFIELIETDENRDHDNIDFIKIMNNPMNRKAYHCTIEYEDGRSEPVGFLGIIDRLGNKRSKESAYKNSLAQAFRRSIRDQIHEFKKDNKLKCEICKARNLEYDKFHVDHIIKFRDLQKNFMEKGYDIPELEDDNINGGKKFKDCEFVEKWKRYHQRKAELRILCETCNLKLK